MPQFKSFVIIIVTFLLSVIGAFYIKRMNIIHPEKLLNFSLFPIIGILYFLQIKKRSPFSLRRLLNILGIFINPFYAICAYESFKQGMPIYGIIYLLGLTLYLLIMFQMDRQSPGSNS